MSIQQAPQVVVIREPSPGNPIVEGLAGVKRATSTISTFVGTFFCIVFIIIGIVLLSRKNNKTKTATGTYNNVVCTGCIGTNCNGNGTGNVDRVQTCTGKVTFQIGTLTFTVSPPLPANAVNGQSVTIYYNPENPMEAEVTQFNYKTAGWTMIGVSIAVLVIIWLVWYMYQRSTTLAAAGGAFDLFNAFRR